MKIQIASGLIPSYLTKGKKYVAFFANGYDLFLTDDNGLLIEVGAFNCRHLNGGSWRICD